MWHFGHFSNFDKRQSEAAGDVISGTASDYVGTEVSASFGDSRLNSGRLCLAIPVLRTFEQYLNAFCSLPEVASDVISSRFVRPIVLDKYEKFHDPSLNHSREI